MASLGDAGSPNGRSTEPFRSTWAASVVRVAKEKVQEARRNRTATRAKRYTQCGPADMCARKHMKRCIFEASRQEAKMRPEVGRARRYAQCVFVDRSAFKRIMSKQRDIFFCNFAKLKPSCANIKTLKNQWKYL